MRGVVGGTMRLGRVGPYLAHFDPVAEVALVELVAFASRWVRNIKEQQGVEQWRSARGGARRATPRFVRARGR
jgi:hypothetical protein